MCVAHGVSHAYDCSEVLFWTESSLNFQYSSKPKATDQVPNWCSWPCGDNKYGATDTIFIERMSSFRKEIGLIQLENHYINFVKKKNPNEKKKYIYTIYLYMCV